MLSHTAAYLIQTSRRNQAKLSHSRVYGIQRFHR